MLESTTKFDLFNTSSVRNAAVVREIPDLYFMITNPVFLQKKVRFICKYWLVHAD